MKGFIELTKIEIDFAQRAINKLHPEKANCNPVQFTVAVSNIAAIIPSSNTSNGVDIEHYTEISLFSPSITIKIKESREEVVAFLRTYDLDQ